MTAREVRGPLRAALDARLAPLGYKRHTSDWRRTVPDGIAVIDVVADKWSASAPVQRVTAHVAFYSERLAAVFGPPAYEGSALDQVHWHRWVGAIRAVEPTPPPDHGMWDVRADDEPSVHAVADAIAMRTAPLLAQYASDEAIRDLWLTEEDLFWSREQQAAYLAVLVAVLGPASALDGLVARLMRYRSRGDRFATRALDVLDLRTRRIP